MGNGEPRVLASAPVGGPRITTAAVVGGLILVLVGFALGAILAGGGGDSPSPRVDDQGVPKGLPRSERGAVEAAATYSSLFSLDAALDEGRASEIANSIATPQYAEELLEQARTLREQAGGRELSAAASDGGAFGHIATLAYRVESFSRDEAAVELWDVAILGGGAVDPPVAGYARDLVTVSWERDGWRIADVEDVGEGPTPTLERDDAPTRAPRFLDTLRSFEEYRGGP